MDTRERCSAGEKSMLHLGGFAAYAALHTEGEAGMPREHQDPRL